MENIDVKIDVNREIFLDLNADFFTRITKPIETALKTSSITMEEINEVILMGAGTRVPKVQVLSHVNFNLITAWRLVSQSLCKINVTELCDEQDL